MKIFSLIMIALCIQLLGTAAIAQTPEGSRRPSAQEIIERLTPAPNDLEAKSVAPMTRSLTARGISVEGRKPQAETQPSIDLDVNFELSSAQLTADAKIILDNLGRALSDPKLQDSHFLLAGHTDASGSDAYNLALSKRRAQAVAEYLGKQFGVEAGRLKVEGYGRTRLLDPANPKSAINRRVQVANLGETNSTAAKDGGLFSNKEADALRYSDSAWAESSSLAPRAITRGPDIVFEKPLPNASEDSDLTVNSPADLEISFKEKLAPVDMGSLDISAEKGFFSVSLTNRLKPYIKGNRIAARNLDIPKGKFVIVISVADQQGNKTSTSYRMQVL